MTVERVTRSDEETEALGLALGRRLRAGDVVALFGELGAGKTRLIRGIAEGLGHDPSVVQSPTFVLAHEYRDRAAPGEKLVSAPTPLVHVDAYRLSGAEELESLGWDALATDEAVVVIEWAERVLNALSAKRIEVWIEHAEQGEGSARECSGSSVRRVRVSAPDDLSDRLANLASTDERRQ